MGGLRPARSRRRVRLQRRPFRPRLPRPGTGRRSGRLRSVHTGQLTIGGSDRVQPAEDRGRGRGPLLLLWSARRRSLHVVRSRVPRRTAPAVGPDRRRRRGCVRQPPGHASPLSGPDRPRRHRQPRGAPMVRVPGGVVSEGTREPRCRHPVRLAGRRGARDHDPCESGSPGPAAGRALQRGRFRRRVQRCRSPARAGVERHGRGTHGAQGDSRQALGHRQRLVRAAATDGPDAAGLLVERREPGRLRAVRRTRSLARSGGHSVSQLRSCEPVVGQVACHGGLPPGERRHRRADRRVRTPTGAPPDRPSHIRGPEDQPGPVDVPHQRRRLAGRLVHVRTRPLCGVELSRRRPMPGGHLLPARRGAAIRHGAPQRRRVRLAPRRESGPAQAAGGRLDAGHLPRVEHGRVVLPPADVRLHRSHQHCAAKRHGVPRCPGRTGLSKRPDRRACRGDSPPPPLSPFDRACRTLAG